MRSGRTLLLLLTLVIGLAIGAGAMLFLRGDSWFARGPEPESVATASLQSLREQARLVPFTARFVAVVTSSQRRFGLSAETTLIMPGTVRYELDLAKLSEEDLRWDAAERRLSVMLPPLEISRPEVALDEMREYGGGGVLSALTDVEQRLQQANRLRGQQELVQQARQPVPMRLARDAAKRVVERSFAMPLRAAGIDATVAVRFGDEPADDRSRLDRSRSIEDVYRNTSS
jgi:hypothetical protein